MQYDKGRYGIVSPFKDDEGDYRYSGEYRSIEKAMLNIGYDSKIGGIETYEDYTFIGIYEPEFETFKVGDKVLVSKDAEKWCKKFGIMFRDGMKNMVGKICEIKEIKVLDHSIWNEDKSEYWFFPPQALSYPMEEDDEVEKAIKLLTEKGKIINGRILS